MNRILFLMLSLVLTSVAAEGSRESEADSLREIVFKRLIYDAAAAQEGYKVYFLSLGYAWMNDRPEIDPSDRLMKRFAGRTPPVKKGSQSKIDEKGEVRDKNSGRRGVIFSVTDLKWVSDHEVEATCGVFKAGLNSSTYKYTLIRKNSQWKVTNKKMISIS
jgi:hypothetical protein